MCDNESHTSPAVNNRCRVRAGSALTARSIRTLLTFSLRIHNRSCYTSLLTRDRKERVRSASARLQGQNPLETPVEARMAVRENDDDEGTVVTSSFLPGGKSEAPGEPTRWTEVPGDRTVPGALLRQPSRPGGRGADMRDTGAPGVPLPGFLCASADRPKRVYGTSPRSPHKAIPARRLCCKMALSPHLAIVTARTYSWTRKF